MSASGVTSWESGRVSSVTAVLSRGFEDQPARVLFLAICYRIRSATATVRTVLDTMQIGTPAEGRLRKPLIGEFR